MTTHELARMYIERIEAIDRSGPRLRSVIEINPDALVLATASDRERETAQVRRPLHGIPILENDNLRTRSEPEWEGKSRWGGVVLLPGVYGAVAQPAHQ